jgi:hypothetical protein
MSSQPPIARRPLPPGAKTQIQHGGRSFGEVSDYREMPTLIADPAVFHGIPDERTPVTELKTPAPEKRSSKLSAPYMVIAGVLLIGIGLVGYRSMTRGARLENTGVAAARVEAPVKAALPGQPQVESLRSGSTGPKAAEPAVAPTSNHAPPSDDPGYIAATPALAARSFALGEYDTALEQYRYLAHQNPDAEVYAVMVKVLTAKTKER